MGAAFHQPDFRCAMTRGFAMPIDLALQFDRLAACAAIVFITAIVLGLL